MIAAHVIIFGSGPRLRSICASLVRDCNIDVHILLVESRESAAVRASAYRTQVLLLDARIAVEAKSFVEFIRDPREVIVASATGWNGQPSSQPAALKTRKPIDPAMLDSSFSLAGPRSNIGSWLEPAEESERQSASMPPVRCHSYGWGFSGYASLSRNLMIGLDGAGIDVAWSADFMETESVDLDERDRAKMLAMSVAHRPNEIPLIFHPPTFTDGRPFLGPLCKIFQIKSPIAITMFETDRVPTRWAEQLARCEQVWVPASFNVESFVAGGVPREKLIVVPTGLDFEHTPVDGSRLVVPHARGFTFLAVSEWTYRKGFDVLLAAYARAFTADDDVTLVIRSHFAGLDIAAEIRRTLKELGVAPERMAPILLLPQKLTPLEFSALYRAADAFVLPTRGEGFGVPCLEAMALGVPTISTDWGGSTDFLTERTGFPISATLEPVARKDSIQFPIFTGQRWAEPSIASTANAMRSVFDRRAEAQVIAARGAALARTKYNRQTTARHAIRALRDYAPKAMPERRSTGTVSFVGDILSANGAGSAARGVMRGLEAQGLNLQGQAPFVSRSANAVRSDEAAFVKSRLRHDATESHVSIVHTRLADLRRVPINASTIIIITAADEHVSEAATLSALKQAKIVCVPSASCATILERSGVDWRRLRIVPACVDTDFWTPEIGSREAEGGQEFRFLSVFDWQRDDGWEALVTAYATAFRSHDRVKLTLGIVNHDKRDRDADHIETEKSFGERCVREMTFLLGARFPDRVRAGDIPQIDLRIGTLAEEDLALLYGSHDAFVLAPRARCSSRAFLEAMACGLPTVAPRSGSHLAFMNDENSYLVDVGPSDDGPRTDLRWEVGVESLATLLRRVVNRPAERAEKGRIARHSVVAKNALRNTGQLLKWIVEEEQALELRSPGPPAPMLRSLCIFVTRSEDPTQLAPCLEYLRRYSYSPNVSIVVRGLTASRQTSARSEVLEIGGSVKEMLCSIGPSSHVAFVDDDVRVGPGWDTLLIDALDSRVGASIASPQTHGEKSQTDQNQARLGYDPLTLVDFNTAIIAHELRFIGRGEYSSMIFPFCAMFDAQVLRDVVKTSAAEIGNLDELFRSALALHPDVWLAYDAKVHKPVSATRLHGIIRSDHLSLLGAAKT